MFNMRRTSLVMVILVSLAVTFIKINKFWTIFSVTVFDIVISSYIYHFLQ